MKTIILTTDGACSGNPGPGGWCAILQFGGHTRILEGHAEHTTNQRMELTAALEGLRALKEGCEVTLISDSKYVTDGIQSWLPGWVSRGWRNSSGKPPENLDLWQDIYEQTKQHRVTTRWVKGHAGHDLNTEADRRAVLQIRKGAQT